MGGITGPCSVGPDSASTAPNPWSFNAVSNMLYVDQPAPVGYSYAGPDPTPQTLDLLTGAFGPGTAAAAAAAAGGAWNWTVGGGVFPSFEPGAAVNTTRTAARGLRAFLEIWLDEFERYRRDEIHLWGVS